jgi:hypothetical protein
MLRIAKALSARGCGVHLDMEDSWTTPPLVVDTGPPGRQRLAARQDAAPRCRGRPDDRISFEFKVYELRCVVHPGSGQSLRVVTYRHLYDMWDPPEGQGSKLECSACATAVVVGNQGPWPTIDRRDAELRGPVAQAPAAGLPRVAAEGGCGL